MKYAVYIGVIGVLLALSAGIYFFMLDANPLTPRTVTLTDSGFAPATLEIEPGDTVTFVSRLDRDHWPASNVHPTHSAYPDFDPRRPLAPDESWQFTFTEPGVYRYHDHIDARFEGEIVVGKPASLTIDACAEEKSVSCFEVEIIKVLEEEGIEAAFDTVVFLSETEPVFGNDCHGYAHLIGEEAYELYVSGTNFELTPATVMCGYGFYHGFMETLLLTSGDVREARAFCRYADQQMAGQSTAVSTACFHGTGHGAVDGGDPRAWGDVNAIMAPGFTLCDQVAETDFQLYLCHTGVFNATEILARDSKYQLQSVMRAPFQTVCNQQPADRLEACYTNMLPVVLTITGNNLAKAANYVNKHMQNGDTPTIENYSTNDMVTLSLFAEYLRIESDDPGYIGEAIGLCRAQPASDQYSCFEGISASHVKYGPPGTGYIKNLEFCAHEALTKDEKDACYGYLLPRLGNNYSPELSRSICSSVPTEWSDKYCLL